MKAQFRYNKTRDIVISKRIWFLVFYSKAVSLFLV